eukprot:Ihof_evm2s404 gene=Ihof_evmTU2s404
MSDTFDKGTSSDSLLNQEEIEVEAADTKKNEHFNGNVLDFETVKASVNEIKVTTPEKEVQNVDDPEVSGISKEILTNPNVELGDSSTKLAEDKPSNPVSSLVNEEEKSKSMLEVPAAMLEQPINMIQTTATASYYGIKHWGMSTLLTARQYMMEKMGTMELTDDPELDSRVAKLFTSKKKYMELIATCDLLLNAMITATTNQKLLSQQLSYLATAEPELQEVYLTSSATYKSLATEAATLIKAIKTLIDNLTTLCDKAMEDTLLSHRAFSQAQLDYTNAKTALDTQVTVEPSKPEIIAALQQKKEKMNMLREAVLVKTDLLDENRLKV